MEYYFTFVQADGILKNIWNLTSAFVFLLGFGLRADVFQNPQLLKYVYVVCYAKSDTIDDNRQYQISLNNENNNGKMGNICNNFDAFCRDYFGGCKVWNERFE